jgi:precorrin-8X/cobalt-precorrin-8 methylmutase
MQDYERNPAAIYRESFATIRREADLWRFSGLMAELVVRLIHACGMVDIAGDIVASEGAAEAGREALRSGAPVICDVEMVRRGIITRMLPAANELVCEVGNEKTAALAKEIGNTRSAAGIELAAERINGAVVAIGNAPTALFHLLEMIDAGLAKPALIIGMPVGFVGAAESKHELAANPRGIPFVALTGRRGGSALAAAAVNALASGLETRS